ncbi:MAG TPA: MEDS domain-containing protein [Bacillota bacterium]
MEMNPSTLEITKPEPFYQEPELRPSGIDIIDPVPWGTHFCQFYETGRDLIETLVPYFREGLEANEFCMWITSPPLEAGEGKTALREAIPDFNSYLAKGQIEILEYNQWYTPTGRFDAEAVLRGWGDKYAAARQQGYTGLRLSGNTFWLEPAAWGNFANYEAKINEFIDGKRILALCTFSLQRCGVCEILDVISNHHFAIIKRAGDWEKIENSRSRQTEQALRKSEERLDLTVWAADLGIFEWDSSQDRIVWENRRMDAIFGQSLQNEPITTTELLERMIHPDDVGSFKTELIENMKPGHLVHTICRIRRRGDGELRWIEIFGRFHSDASGNLRLKGGVGDITPRKQVEKALQVKEEELIAAYEELLLQQQELNSTYRDLQRQREEIREHEIALTVARDEAERHAAELDATISSIAAGVIIYNASGNIIRINEFARILLEISGDVYNLPYQEFLERFKVRMPDGTPYEVEQTPLSRALRGEIIREEEMMITRNPDKPVWLSATFAPILHNNRTIVGVISIFTDITERKRRVEDLLASERELLRVTLDSLGEGVVAADQEERIIFINEAAVNLSGYSRDDALGELVYKILYLIDDKTSEPIEKIHSRAVYSQLILVTRDLREVMVSINCSPIKAPNGRIIGKVIVVEDISEKQKIEQGLLKTAKLESLGILAGGVAHDFNNILAGILANLQLGLFKLKMGQDISKYLENTIETTRKASGLTKQLLTFAKGGDPVKKSTSITKLMKDAVLFALSGSKVKAKFHLPEDLWIVDVDEGQIIQVINNLTINAEQAMLTGGILEIYGENVIFPEDGNYTPGQYVKLTMKDHGIGIPEEIIDKIFDPFFTTKKTGNGLGLSTSYSIIKKHGGYLEVESAPGIGTTFYILLPAINQELNLKESPRKIEAGGDAKILLMDDEDTIRNIGGEMLSCFGYRVTLAGNGQEAVGLYKQAKEIGEPYDAVIMDLTVPGGLGGIETMAILRQVDPDVKAIISSGYAGNPVMSDYERYGFKGVVIKPYKFDELNKVLHQVLDEKQLPLDLTY